MSHVNYKKCLCCPVKFQKSMVAMSILRRSHVFLNPLSLRPRKRHVAMSILGVHTHSVVCTADRAQRSHGDTLMDADWSVISHVTTPASLSVPPAGPSAPPGVISRLGERTQVTLQPQSQSSSAYSTSTTLVSWLLPVEMLS